MAVIYNRRRERAMTLLEILIAIALFAIFTLTLTQLLMGGMRTYRRGQAISTMRNDIKNALDTIDADVRSAYKVSEDLLKGSASLEFSLYTNKQVLGSSATPRSVEEVDITYKLVADEGVLLRTEGTQTSVLARDLLVSDVMGSSESYFTLATDGTDETEPYTSIEARLTAMRYVGTDEQRMSMVTRTQVSADYSATEWASSQVVNYVPLHSFPSSGDWFFTGNETAALSHPLSRSFTR